MGVFPFQAINQPLFIPSATLHRQKKIPSLSNVSKFAALIDRPSRLSLQPRQRRLSTADQLPDPLPQFPVLGDDRPSRIRDIGLDLGEDISNDASKRLQVALGCLVHIFAHHITYVVEQIRF